FNMFTPTLNLNNVTITDNKYTGSTVFGAGGVKNTRTVNMRNTIISGNTADTGSSDDVSGTFISQGNNLVNNNSGSIGFGFPGSNDVVGQPAFLTGLGSLGGQTNLHGFFTTAPF